MKSSRDPKFDKLFALLPGRIQELARKNYALWRVNPWHPSLNFEELNGGLWSVRIGDHHRALGVQRADGSMLWYWIGSHEAYNKLIARG